MTITATAVRIASTRARSVRCTWTPPQVLPANLSNVGTVWFSRNLTPGRSSAVNASAHRQSMPGAPISSNGRVVPRPSDSSVPSNRQVPG